MKFTKIRGGLTAPPERPARGFPRYARSASLRSDDEPTLNRFYSQHDTILHQQFGGDALQSVSRYMISRQEEHDYLKDPAAPALLLPPPHPAAAPPARTCYMYRDPNYKYHRPNFQFKRKNYVAKFKRDRRLKFIKVDLPDPNDKIDTDAMTPEELRAKVSVGCSASQLLGCPTTRLGSQNTPQGLHTTQHSSLTSQQEASTSHADNHHYNLIMKEKGVRPVRPWQEVPLSISATTGTFEAYVPPEGDGKVSALSTAGAKQSIQRVEKKGKSMMAVRKIRQFDDEFDPKVFAEEAQEIYVATHKALAEGDEDTLHQCVTERAFPLVTHETKHKTIRWQFLGSLEAPRVVHARTTDVITKENIFAQITVRFHTKQVVDFITKIWDITFEASHMSVPSNTVFQGTLNHSHTKVKTSIVLYIVTSVLAGVG
ncbi:putative 39S ribosomal protein L45, mitochondrial [Chionoecetes opilio]|uniref:Large ribosomal subunit protein mL45 n=1 Tax=Chionoecetes opilio TaxID=41210 RepID=A0A8J4YCS9_CHIOP|nr:putative 39S ribosomal protein L45, mitochondrial [Chionoecetes opilio]